MKVFKLIVRGKANGLLQTLVLVEDQSTHFDALPVLFILTSWDMKRGMRHTPCPSIFLGVEALDQDDFFWAKV